jgi:N-methylhydantoinase A
LLDVIDAAAEDLRTTRFKLLARAEVLISGTTRATNAIVEGKTARTAFVTTHGHRDILLVREGGGRPTINFMEGEAILLRSHISARTLWKNDLP